MRKRTATPYPSICEQCGRKLRPFTNARCTRCGRRLCGRHFGWGGSLRVRLGLGDPVCADCRGSQPTHQMRAPW